MTPVAQRLFAYHVAIAHAVLRLTLGVALLMHGLVRLRTGPSAFADHLADQFAAADSMFPRTAVHAFAYAVPCVEAVLGGLLILGLLCLPALIATGLWMAALVVGSCSLQDWPTVAVQLNYALVIFVLLAGQPYDQWSVDGLLRGASRRD